MFRRSLLALLLLPALASAQPRPEPLVNQVRSGIDRGVNFLRRMEAGKGHWEIGDIALQRPGGASVLTMLALLNAGVPHDDPMIRRGLDEMRKFKPQQVYTVGLHNMVYAEIGDARDKERVQQYVDWLLKARVYQAGKLQGWSYGQDGGQGDNSNSQYALLGLHAGHQMGAAVTPSDWKEIRDFYRDTQTKGTLREEGGWAYHPERGSRTPMLTMTVAGLCGLEICAMNLQQSRQGLLPDGTAQFCGSYPEDDAIRKAIQWLSGTVQVGGSPRFRFDDSYTYYNCYGIERAGRLTGQRFLAGRDWYREGCEYLVALQQEDGSWTSVRTPAATFTPIVNTSFALLFLSKGRTPVLIAKWAHGAGDGWNNKHYDAKHLVEFASKELFQKQPLAWQVYDARKSEFRSREERSREVATLLQTPILYANGHAFGEPTPTQKQILKQYLDEGGFLMAESCCGRFEFAAGFRKLMAELYPDNPLRPLPADHPIWRTYAVVRPDFVQLEGIDMGCKTVVVFSPQPLSGYWEENLQSDGRGKEAFRLAANIIAYATGLEKPKDRLTPGEVIDERQDRDNARGFFQVAQLRHEGDWQPAPRAMRNLMRHLRETVPLDVALRTEEIVFQSPELFKYKFLYLHGRAKFEPPAAGVENLRENLKAGATLLADACCGSAAFDTAFREFAAKLFPGGKLEAIPADDPLYGAEVNGRKIDSVRVRTGNSGSRFDSLPPALEGIRVDGRWAVLYSKYDLGCALEKHQSGDCKGHDHDSALRLAGAAVLYSLKK